VWGLGYSSGQSVESRRPFVRQCQPEMTVAEVVKEFFVLLPIHFTRPDYFGLVNVRFVVDPFLVKRMLRRVMNDHEMLALRAIKLFQDVRAARSFPRVTAPGK